MDAVKANALAAAIGQAVGDIEYLAVGAGGITPGRIEHVPGVGQGADEDGQRGRERQPRNHNEDKEADEEKRGRAQRGRNQGAGDGDLGHESWFLGRFFSRFLGRRLGLGGGSAVNAGEDVIA